MGVFPPGSVIRNRSRLWRVDGQEGDVLIATSIDGGEAERTRFYVPCEDIRPSRLESPSPFIWDEERRAHLYGLTRDELAYILDTFPIVRRKDEER